MTEAHVRKAFAYAVRGGPRGPELLVFRTHEEPEGFEVPKGALEPGESFAGAARRELLEESGIDAVAEEELGRTWYGREEQRFFLFSLPAGTPARFRHVVTGPGGDAGLAYEYEFLPIDRALGSFLVQGSGTFARELTRRLVAKT